LVIKLHSFQKTHIKTPWYPCSYGVRIYFWRYLKFDRTRPSTK
jgi:hypothetical protein